MSNPTADIGLIGLAVMGQNLVMNMNDHGFTVAVYNRTTATTDEFMDGAAKGSKVIGTRSLEDFVRQLKRPRRVMLLVRAGGATDATIDGVAPLLESGDIIIDGGNSHFPDTERRAKVLAEKKILFVGCGVSGGEEGARHGPSMMPGGAPDAWPHLKEIFQSIAAQIPTDAAASAGSSSKMVPCCDWIGPGGSGHYVKMVHNGIEYGDMQLIAEAYQMLIAAGYSHDEMAALFRRWDEGPMKSYLIEITATILAFKDDAGEPIVPKILDTAEQKGTGKWTATDALELGIPLTLIGEAVFARCVSSMLRARQAATRVLVGPDSATAGASPFGGAKLDAARRPAFEQALEHALYASKIVSYAQGFLQLQAACGAHKWGELDYGGVALMWRGGCIIRSAFLDRIAEAFVTDRTLENIMLAPFFREALSKAQSGWRSVVAHAALTGVPAPAFGAALSFYDSIRCVELPASLTQAQRDFFGAHQFVLRAEPSKPVHVNWTGRGGGVTSNVYRV
eukprot:TRINITY_DN3948_c0_g2_i1.p1 TRINITY_DN3948_c0_g2~~TRINITY_DN3948_c0_g2_i1.p1  ORF type:complete len:508 (+),score=133.18 TRINITY_DN3948_c0_g2_i1:179-1702(+)